MMPRPHPETNKNLHKRFAQHIGSPRRGVFIAVTHEAAASPGDYEKKSSTDYTDYTNFLFFL
jgi:hypothetical protein